MRDQRKAAKEIVRGAGGGWRRGGAACCSGVSMSGRVAAKAPAWSAALRHGARQGGTVGLSWSASPCTVLGRPCEAAER